MENGFLLVLLSALPIGLIHTLIGPDHYVPFVVLSKSRSWSLSKTLGITAACGVGHVLSAAVLGLAAVSLGQAFLPMDIIERVRGSVAAWLLTGFGFVYFVWGIRSAIRNRTHSHSHFHPGMDSAGIGEHEHVHSHDVVHSHVHESERKKELTPWVLFVIFIFGPCEPLIPLVMYPAVQESAVKVLMVILTFGVSTLITMLAIVTASSLGMKKLERFPFFERYGNAFSGGVICSCGLAITFLGL